MKRNLVKIIIAIVAIVAVYSLLSHYGVTDYLKRDNIPKIKEKIDSFGPIAPLVYIGFYILATVFFLPGLPVTMLSGLAFGPIWGVVYASIGAVIGVSCAFLSCPLRRSRYGGGVGCKVTRSSDGSMRVCKGRVGGC